MFPFIPMLIGAAGGALMNRKDPLKGALLGGGLGAAGGLLAPAAMGAGGATGAATPGIGGAAGNTLASAGMAELPAGAGMTYSGGVPIVDVNAGAAAVSPGSWSPGMFERMGMSKAVDRAGGLLNSAEKFTKPVGTAMQAAQMMKPQDEPMPMPNIPQRAPVASPAFSQIAQNRNNMQAQRMEMENARKNRRYGLINSMMG